MGRDYNSDKYYEDNFDYESAREDLFDAGLDPDYLSTRNREQRDKYMKKTDSIRRSTAAGIPNSTKHPTRITLAGSSPLT